MSLPDNYLSIDTPENVAFGYRVAGIGSRFLALLVDTLLIIVLLALVNFVLVLLARVVLTTVRYESIDTLEAWIGAIFTLFNFAVLWGYFIFFEMVWNGQSPGKRWVGLRVIRTDGTPVTLVESIIRNVMRLVDFLPAFYGLGVVTMFVNEQSRRLGDLAAGTLVVYDRVTVTLASLKLQAVDPTENRPGVKSSLDLPLKRLTNGELQLVEEYLNRRDTLANRSVLANRLAHALFAQMDLPPPELEWQETEKLLIEIIQVGWSRPPD